MDEIKLGDLARANDATLTLGINFKNTTGITKIVCDFCDGRNIPTQSEWDAKEAISFYIPKMRVGSEETKELRACVDCVRKVFEYVLGKK